MKTKQKINNKQPPYLLCHSNIAWLAIRRHNVKQWQFICTNERKETEKSICFIWWWRKKKSVSGYHTNVGTHSHTTHSTYLYSANLLSFFSTALPGSWKHAFFGHNWQINSHVSCILHFTDVWLECIFRTIFASAKQCAKNNCWRRTCSLLTQSREMATFALT